MRLERLNLADVGGLSQPPFDGEPAYVIVERDGDVLGTCFITGARTLDDLVDQLAQQFGAEWRERAVAAAVGHREAWQHSPRVPTPPITVVVPTTGDPRQLRRCLSSVRDQLQPGDELIVADNSHDGDAAALAAELGARWVHEPGSGAARARNAGWRAAHSTVIAFIDDDCVADREWLAAIRDGFAAPDTDAVTGSVLASNIGSAIARQVDEHYPYHRGFRPIRFAGTTGTSHSPFDAWRVGTGASMAWRRDRLEQLGGFDPALGAGLGLGGDDIDLFERALVAGMTIDYRPDALVLHEHPETEQALRESTSAFTVTHGVLAAKRRRSGPTDGQFRWLAAESGSQLRHGWSAVRDSLLGRNHPTVIPAQLAAPFVLTAGAVAYRQQQRTGHRLGHTGRAARDTATTTAPSANACRHAEAHLDTGQIVDPGGPTPRRFLLRVDGRVVGYRYLAGPELDRERLLTEVVPAAIDQLHPRLSEPADDDAVFRALRTGRLPRHPSSPAAGSPNPRLVTAVVPSNRPAVDVAPLLERLAGVCEVILVENGTPEPRLAELAARVGAQHVHRVVAGTSVARNVGAELASSPWLLFIDDDCRLDDATLPVLAERIAGAIECADHRVGAITCRLIPDVLDTEVAAEFERDYAHHRGFLPRRFHLDSAVHRRWPLNGIGMMGVGGCFLARREAWKAVDGFDPRFGGGAPWRSGEDDIFFLDLVEAGWTVWYEPSLSVGYRHLTEPASVTKALYGYGYGHSAYLLSRATRGNRADLARFWGRTLLNYLSGVRSNHGRFRASEFRGFVAGTTALRRLRAGRRDRSA